LEIIEQSKIEKHFFSYICTYEMNHILFVNSRFANVRFLTASGANTTHNRDLQCRPLFGRKSVSFYFTTFLVQYGKIGTTSFPNNKFPNYKFPKDTLTN
jgi:hypothetical protein